MIALFLRFMSLMAGMFCLAMAISLGQVDSAFVNFSALAPDQLMIFRVAFFVGFSGFVMAVPFIGDSV